MDNVPASPSSASVYDWLTKTMAVPFPRGPEVQAATARTVVDVLQEAGWAVCVNGTRSLLFTNPYGQAARLFCLPDGVWRLSADPGFAREAHAMLHAMADHAFDRVQRAMAASLEQA